jgi:hypothetical protein
MSGRAGRNRGERIEREWLREMREDAESPERREDFARAAQAQRATDPAGFDGLAAALELCTQLRELFGDPSIDRTPWPERDFRL